MKYLGKFWNDKNLEVYEIDGRNIVLNKWDGEKYFECFELAENLIDIIDNQIEVKPIYKEVEEDKYDIVGFEIL